MKICLNVPQILQKPELPNGCEITSLCEVLNYLGFPADKCDLADHYLPRSEKWYGTDPDQFYMGNPHLDDDSEETGYYCFAGPIVKAAGLYLDTFYKDAGREISEDSVRIPAKQLPPVRPQPRDLTGAGQDELERILKDGHPFIFWASLHFDDIRYDKCGSFVLPDGRVHRVFHELHCMVCRGMDDGGYYIADPLDYNEYVPKTQFMKIYRQLGSRAAAVF